MTFITSDVEIVNESNTNRLSLLSSNNYITKQMYGD